jgi:hypothetical protein
VLKWLFKYLKIQYLLPLGWTLPEICGLKKSAEMEFCKIGPRLKSVPGTLLLIVAGSATSGICNKRRMTSVTSEVEV